MMNCLRRINSQLTTLAYAIGQDSGHIGLVSSSGAELDTEEVLVRKVGPKEEKHASANQK